MRFHGRWLGTVAVALGCVASPAAAIAAPLSWIEVGAPGNACRAEFQGCFGAVPYVYRISALEVTNEQYVEFLNAVARSDPNELYNPLMNTSFLGGITRSGEDGNYGYALKPGFADKPVNFVSFYDALRFANWMHNGRPTGAQGAATTEDGTYTITPAGIAANSITRNPQASVFLTSEDEWYKAAYFDPASGGYVAYPAGTDTQTTCSPAGATPNTANCDFAVGELSDGGAYSGSPSPSGTFDQGGNVEEWNESVILGTLRGARGGSASSLVLPLAAAVREAHDPSTYQVGVIGFRVATVPEANASLLGWAAIASLAASQCIRRLASPSR